MNTEMDELWSALANPVRRKMLDLLREGPRTTGEVTASFPELSRFAVMQHLGVLAACSLVLVRREGRQRFNYLNAVPLQTIYERWVSRYARTAAAATLDLKRHVERPEGVGMAEEDRQQGGRVVKFEMECRFAAPIEKVFAALTTEIDAWWAFRFRENATVICEPWVGGRIYEDWGNGAGALYGTVCHYEPPFRFGSRGPGAIDGNYSSLNWEVLERDGDGTLYRKSLRLWGEVPAEAEQMFAGGMRTIVEQQLKAYVEQGKGRSDS